jgi:hypothetical protein
MFCHMQKMPTFVCIRGLQRDVVYHGWPTNSALVYEPKCGGGGGCGVSANEYRYGTAVYTGAQINFGDLTPYLTYGLYPRSHNICVQLPLREGIVSYLKIFKFVFVPVPIIHSKSHLPYMNTFDLQATRVLCLQFFLTKLLFSLQMHRYGT